MHLEMNNFGVLQNFRAGFADNAIQLKRAFGIDRANRKGHDNPNACSWPAALSYYLMQ